MNFIAGKSHELSHTVLAKMASYRHKVFIETLGWEMPTSGGKELDQFDRPDTIYVLSEDAQGRLNGCARLLPTEQPYLLSEVFPQLLDGSSIPKCPKVWELSRFAALDFHGPSCSPLSQFSSPVAVKLLQASIDCAAAHGAERLITVSPLGVGRLLNRAGFRARRAGPPTMVEGRPLFACWIDVAARAGVEAGAGLN